MTSNLLTRAAIVAFIAGGMVACESEGPAERAGQALDDVADQVTDAGRDLGNAVEDACEDIKKESGAIDTDC